MRSVGEGDRVPYRKPIGKSGVSPIQPARGGTPGEETAGNKDRLDRQAERELEAANARRVSEGQPTGNTQSEPTPILVYVAILLFFIWIVTGCPGC